MPKPSIPQGTRDFGAETIRKRNYIFNTIREVFELYGFQPLETPAIENLETLTGKYGEEGDQLIFKILNNGLDNPSRQQMVKTAFQKVLEGNYSAEITERALRYDLTIPFARYVAAHHGQLTLPFKRYQMQPVWRADRPQKGRYREFWQCDADLVGSTSLLSDVEFANIYANVFRKLNLEVEIKINNRKILTALAETCRSVEKLTDITVSIDKLDKIGRSGVLNELSQKGLDKDQVETIENYLSIDGNNEEKLDRLTSLLGENETANKGIRELAYVLGYPTPAANPLLSVDFTLARGLNYYTGIIFEVKAKKMSMGSIGGGGRYDDLTGLFGVPNMPGAGISFGVDRIYDVMEESGLFPEDIYCGTKVLFFNLGDKESRTAFDLMQELRATKISCELFLEAAKFDKQFKYGDKKNIPYVVIIGTKELSEKSCTVKNMKTGFQQNIPQAQLATFFSDQLRPGQEASNIMAAP